MDINTKIKEALSFQIRRKLIDNTKYFLIQLELLKEDYLIQEENFKELRKKSLDNMNYAIREIDELIEKLDIKLK